MAINWGILDPNAPAKAGMAFSGGFDTATKNALAMRQAKQQEASNALAMRGQSQTQQMNALALQKAQSAAGREPAEYAQKQQTMQREQAMERMKFLGPLAKSVLEAGDKEAAYQAAHQAVVEMYPEYAGKMPQTLQEAMPQLQQTATVWEQMNPAEYTVKDGQYIPTEPGRGEATAIPGYVKPSAEVTPTNLAKLMAERDALAETVPEGDPRLAAYDEQITGSDVSAESLTPEEINLWGGYLNQTGKMPSLGRGKESTKIRKKIVKAAAQQALSAGRGASDIVGTQADVKAITASLGQQEKQRGAIGSFVKNLEMQVDKVKEISKTLKTFDARLLNIPLRAARGRIAGNPQQAKYDMYLAEIESEIGKLATGSTASVAELSQGAQERWSRIHDKNLSINDMLQLLEETKAAGNMRMKSVADTIEETRGRLRKQGVGGGTGETVTHPDFPGFSIGGQ